jgi:hypothetical protein
MVTYRLWIKKWQWLGDSVGGSVGKMRVRRSEWYRIHGGSGSGSGVVVVEKR